jgi:hypothetical protein
LYEVRIFMLSPDFWSIRPPLARSMIAACADGTSMPDKFTHAALVSGQGSAAYAGLLEPALMSAALAAWSGKGGETPAIAVASMNLNLTGAAAEGESVSVSAWVDRATRTLIFASGEVRRSSDGSVLAATQAVMTVGAGAPA